MLKHLSFRMILQSVCIMLLPLTVLASKGIWVHPDELAQLPTTGAAWEQLLATANSSIGSPDLSNQDDPTNVQVLAKALVFARTGQQTYREQVIQACMAAIDTELGGRTLALARELAAYVIAADLVGLPSEEDSRFRSWLRRTLTEELSGRTLVSTHEDRPNNWGTHAGASRAAVAVYLGDRAELDRTAQVFKGYLGDRQAFADFKYGELSWQVDESNPVGINPKGAMKSGHSIDGVMPDDMRRGGSFTWPPEETGYPWEGLQGIVVQAEILYRAGYDTWNWQDQAILRAVNFLYDLGWKAEGDDEWSPWIIDYHYGTSFHESAPARTGKNMGWTDWTHSPERSGSVPPPSNTENGSILGNVTDSNTGNPVAAQIELYLSGARIASQGCGEQGSFVFENLTPGDYTLITSCELYQTLQLSCVLTSESLNQQLEIVLEKSSTDEPVEQQYTLSTKTMGEGEILIDPQATEYPAGTSVHLTAQPANGWVFAGWSGDVESHENPLSLAINSNSSVVATFIQPVNDDGSTLMPVHEQTITAAALRSNMISCNETFTVGSGQFFLATLVSKPHREVIAITGLGLDWYPVANQCGARKATGIYSWMAFGDPDLAEPVKAKFDHEWKNAVMTISRYQNVDANNPVATVVSMNTLGIDGGCSGGKDSANFNLPMNINNQNSRLVLATATRHYRFETEADFAQRARLLHGSGGDVAGLALYDREEPEIRKVAIQGKYSRKVDFAVVALELQGVTRDGGESSPSHFTSAVKPEGMNLMQNYPNPFNPGTTIQYSLQKDAMVTLAIYDIRGRQIAQLVSENQATGQYQIYWQAMDAKGNQLPSGIYFYRLSVDQQTVTRRMQLLK
jgi:hypothetical protein